MSDREAEVNNSLLLPPTPFLTKTVNLHSTLPFIFRHSELACFTHVSSPLTPLSPQLRLNLVPNLGLYLSFSTSDSLEQCELSRSSLSSVILKQTQLLSGCPMGEGNLLMHASQYWYLLACYLEHRCVIVDLNKTLKVVKGLDNFLINQPQLAEAQCPF